MSTAVARLARMAEKPSNLIVLAALGVASGMVSAAVGIERPLDGLQPLATLFGLHASLLPVGCIFAVAMAIGLWQAVHRASAVIAALVATLYGWSGAIHIAIRLQRNVGDDAHLVAAGLVAGAFGAGLVLAAFAVFVPAMRRTGAWMCVCGVGAAAGLVFYFGERGFIDKRALFLIWQTAVATTLGLLLDRDAEK